MGYIMLASIQCFIIYFFSGLYVYKTDKKASANFLYMLLCFSDGIWSLVTALRTQPALVQYANFWSVIEYTALSIIAGLIMNFAVAITKDMKSLKAWKTQAIIYIPCTIFFIIRLFLSSTTVAYEIFKIIFFAYNLINLGISMYLIRQWGRSSSLNRIKKQASIIFYTCLTATLLTIFNNVMNFFIRGRSIPQVPSAPFIITTIGILYAMVKYKFMSASSLITAEDILPNVTNSIILLTPEGKIVSVNDRIKQFLGYNEVELLKMNFNEIISAESEGLDIRIIKGKYEKVQFADQYLKTKSGASIPIDIYASRIKDSCGDTAGIVVIGKDKSLIMQLQQEINERKQAEEMLRYVSIHDVLTGLHNRTRFEQEMQEISKSGIYPVSIVLLDVDGLKFVNDTMGHKHGDALLVTAAEVMEGFQAENQLVSRIGGDEFAILLKGGGRNQVAELVNNLKEALADYNIKNTSLPLNISMGYASTENSPKSVDDIFKEADNNMYRIKLSQRHSVRNAISQTLTKTLEARDFITEGHGDRLRELTGELAALAGLSGQQIEDIKYFAQFHDIGKVGIPDRILFKEGKLTEEEAAEMKRHSEIGYRIAQASPELMHISEWILMHHEWWNGQGYPMGISERDIPVQSRILTICDAYDAMTNDRPYRKALSKEMAVAELRKFSGIQFDPELVEIFIENMILSSNEKLEAR